MPDEPRRPRRRGDHRTQNGVIGMQETTSKKTSSQDASHSAREAVRRKTRNSTPLNFKVSEEFRREFKTYAAQHNMKLNQLLVDAFAALKEKDVK